MRNPYGSRASSTEQLVISFYILLTFLYCLNLSLIVQDYNTDESGERFQERSALLSNIAEYDQVPHHQSQKFGGGK